MSFSKSFILGEKFSIAWTIFGTKCACIFEDVTDIMFAFDLFAGVISLLEHNEDYVITFPSTYCRCVFLRYFNFRSDCIWKRVRGANG